MDLRVSIALFFLAGIITALWALIDGVRKTKDQLQVRKSHYKRHIALNAERAEEEQPPSSFDDATEWQNHHNSLNQKYSRIREEEGIRIYTLGTLDLTGQQGAIELLEESVAAVKNNLIWAGSGILISGVASVWSLWAIVE